MSGVRVLVGTIKGAFILKSDEARKEWNISEPHFGGWEIFHMTGSSVDPNRLYMSQSTGWFRTGNSALRRWRADIGQLWATSLPMTVRPAPISGTTARSTRGSLTAFGIWNHRQTTQTRSTQE